MCGLTGFASTSGFESGWAERVATGMASAIMTRGPDDAGVWVDGSAGIALAHRRLSIVDLSPAGHQPMVSGSQRFVLAFNGEIYNHLELRAALERSSAAIAWRGHSDTETLLACIEAWGLQHTLERCVGMFALALWDRQAAQLSLARDRFGEKPLYYGWQGSTFLFGSELKALKAYPGFCASVDRQALTAMMRFGYVPAPYSIYQGIFKLPAASWLTLRPAAGAAAMETPKTYWSLQQAIQQGKQNPFQGSAADAVNELEQVLRQSVRLQMMADVPLGAFLSGGVDSSLITALMQAESSRPVQTYTIGFAEEGYNEAAHAREVARHLGTAHTELYVSAQDAVDQVALLPAVYDEPFADSSQIPTMLVSRMARQHVTVALSGDGGDEIFGGYNRYLLADRLWGRLRHLPPTVASAMSRCLTAMPEERWDAFYQVMSFLLPQRFQVAQFGNKLHKLAEIMQCGSPEALYQGLVSQWQHPEQLVLNGSETPGLFARMGAGTSTDGFVPWMMAMDTMTYMADDILVKVDRAAMAASLESRVPMLDHRVVEFAWRLPHSMKVSDGQGKWILRQLLYKHVPKNLIERPKQGFAIPVAAWLRGHLRPWAEDLLSEQRLRRDGYFNVDLVRKKWEEHVSGRRNWQAQLWCVLAFNSWLQSDGYLQLAIA
ncbi:asparagine synthase (glutamine-hydrolyzing) [Aquitalea magnusonii]|uniref:asparagine synthase (glutamine-hydrolyzing) n=1 Tax=Aquitalea magnusonii TaxID=332411 RepID=A0A318J557_9NEIS|nr:asparagine synthase (glutamine-hydrolyzing) [Aquitalea magnusonii]PXX42801.1 asparagine synthase (glutamine-hydrolysing) [Aquitalea magnusonii]